MTRELNNKTINNIAIPSILYGTAWKEDDTQCLVAQALMLGFKGIDTTNQSALLAPYIQKLAKQFNKTIQQVIFRFAAQIAILPLTGTTSPQHMTEDLNIDDFELSSEEIQYIENIVNL